ncbi:hypothetical protein Prudu_002632 [Prunus dulcis]|uniref:Uncharacterized protein n=1 Tax=Prunus dulcis TaxID=3755 RepID=A0A4Y1QRA4_PRUDU|nr:hypothetical protein Prudu_002632 [Prunus dulcis]
MLYGRTRKRVVTITRSAVLGPQIIVEYQNLVKIKIIMLRLWNDQSV